MITIENLAEKKPAEPWEVKVDKSTPLGAPTKVHSDYVRNLICEDYDKLFHEELKHRYKKALKELEDAYERYGKLSLFCNCAPKRCHAETIRSYLLDKSRTKPGA